MTSKVLSKFEDAVNERKRLVEEYAELNRRLRRWVARRDNYVDSICSLRASQGREVQRG